MSPSAAQSWRREAALHYPVPFALLTLLTLSFALIFSATSSSAASLRVVESTPPPRKPAHTVATRTRQFNGVSCRRGDLEWSQYNRCSRIMRKQPESVTAEGGPDAWEHGSPVNQYLCMGDTIVDADGHLHEASEGYDPCALSTCPGWSCRTDAYALVQQYDKLPEKDSHLEPAWALRPLTTLATGANGHEKQSLAWPCLCMRTNTQGGPGTVEDDLSRMDVVVPRGAPGHDLVRDYQKNARKRAGVHDRTQAKINREELDADL